MRLLREYIREILLTEAVKGPQDLIDIPDVFIKVGDFGDKIEVEYDSGVFIDPSRPRLKSGELEAGDRPWGHIAIGKKGGAGGYADYDLYGPCGDAFHVMGSGADHGWGPLLYDVAMEYATMNGGGMIADRTSVSGDARKVWDYYLGNRGDVTAHQLDDLENTLTPDIEEDNCDQLIVHSSDWIKSPLSKRYTKTPTTIDALRQAGRLIEK